MKINGRVMVPHEKELLPGISIYTKDGPLDTEKMRMWIGEATSTADGVLAIDWSSAKFIEPPFHVNVTAVQPATATVIDRAWATLVNNYTKDGGVGYTLRGNTSGILLGGAALGTRIAPGIKVTVTCWGRISN
jgi:hypothetical protein